MNKEIPSACQAVIAREAITRLLVEYVPEWEWLLQQTESKKGRYWPPPTLARLVSNLKIENYPQLYLNERAILACWFKSFFSVEDLQSLNREIDSATPLKRGKFVEQFVAGCAGAADLLPTPGNLKQHKEEFEALSADQQKQSIQQAQYFFSGFLAMFYQNLSLMVHGEKMTSLVAQAVSGNDEAFVKAVQVDARCLTEIPYFRQRFVTAREQQDEDFCDAVAYRIRRPPYKGKIRYKSLWFTFSMLDSCGLLSLPPKEILDICDQAGVGGYKNRIEDVKYIPKQIKRYLEFQRRGIVSTP
jgi:hypothetical protein